jgi:DNA-directed RNA polymerase specialized sigma24 family protein
VSERDVDWSVLEYPGVRTVARKAASKVATDYSDLATVDYDDLYQEALILLATNGEAQDCLGDPDLGLGVLYHRLVRDLEDTLKTEARRHTRQTSLDRILEAGEDATAPRRAMEADSVAGGDYSRELVEQLLPAVWDSSLAFGMTNPNAPDPDMPRATIDVSHGCTLYAHLADIRSAWKRAPLTLKERRALLLRYGLGWEHREIGAHEGVSRQAITARLDAAVGRLRDHLNGAQTW